VCVCERERERKKESVLRDACVQMMSGLVFLALRGLGNQVYL